MSRGGSGSSSQNLIRNCSHGSAPHTNHVTVSARMVVRLHENERGRNELEDEDETAVPTAAAFTDVYDMVFHML